MKDFRVKGLGFLTHSPGYETVFTLQVRAPHGGFWGFRGLGFRVWGVYVGMCISFPPGQTATTRPIRYSI